MAKNIIDADNVLQYVLSKKGKEGDMKKALLILGVCLLLGGPTFAQDSSNLANPCRRMPLP